MVPKVNGLWWCPFIVGINGFMQDDWREREQLVQLSLFYDPTHNFIYLIEQQHCYGGHSAIVVLYVPSD